MLIFTSIKCTDIRHDFLNYGSNIYGLKWPKQNYMFTIQVPLTHPTYVKELTSLLLPAEKQVTFIVCSNTYPSRCCICWTVVIYLSYNKLCACIMGEIRVPGNMSLFKGNTLVILFSFVRTRKVHKTYICFIEKIHPFF